MAAAIGGRRDGVSDALRSLLHIALLELEEELAWHGSTIRGARRERGCLAYRRSRLTTGRARGGSRSSSRPRVELLSVDRGVPRWIADLRWPFRGAPLGGSRSSAGSIAEFFDRDRVVPRSSDRKREGQRVECRVSPRGGVPGDEWSSLRRLEEQRDPVIALPHAAQYDAHDQRWERRRSTRGMMRVNEGDGADRREQEGRPATGTMPGDTSDGADRLEPLCSPARRRMPIARGNDATWPSRFPYPAVGIPRSSHGRSHGARVEPPGPGRHLRAMSETALPMR